MLPEGWEHTKFGHAFNSSRTKGRPGLSTLSVTLTEGLVARDSLDRKMDTNLTAGEHLLVKTGDIAYNMMRMWQGASGLASHDALVSPAYVVLRAKNNIDPLFAAYLFKLARTIHLFWAYSYGITDDRLRLYFKDFSAIPVNLPPLPEQRKIAEILSTWDRAIEVTQKLIANARAQKKALMQQLLTGKKRLPGFSGEWRRGTLSDFLLAIFGGGTPDKSKSEYWGGDIAWASVKDMGGLYLSQTVDSITRKGLEASSSKIVEPGRVITATRMAVGSVTRATIPVAINQDLKAFIPSAALSDDYLFLLLRYWAPALELRGTGSTVKGIRLETLEGLPVQIPEPEEQAAISEVILSNDRETDQRLASLRVLKTEKAALMQQLLTGKRRVTVEREAACA